jgi:hypothetical protein
MSIAVAPSLHASIPAHDAVGPRPAFDWAVTFFCGMFLGGIFLDGWAHTHGRVDATFFTPWHAVLYSSYLATTVVLVGRAAWSIRHGAAWRDALPDGYALSLLGVACWIVGGPFDVAWHSVFGFEADVEALMSPAHVLLALGFGLMASGPLRAGLRRPRGAWAGELPMILSMAFVISDLTFFTQIAHPLSNRWGAGRIPASHDATELGLVSVTLTAAILIAPVLFLLRHDRLPAGALTILVTLNSVAMGFLYDQGDYPYTAVLAFAVGAVVADLFRLALRPGPDHPGRFRAFAFGAPAVVHGAYFASLLLTVGLTWSPHLWLGSVVFTGVVGWLSSYLLLPPRLPRREASA